MLASRRHWPRKLLLLTDFHLDVDIAPSPVLIDLEELRIKIKVCVLCVCVCFFQLVFVLELVMLRNILWNTGISTPIITQIRCTVWADCGLVCCMHWAGVLYVVD